MRQRDGGEWGVLFKLAVSSTCYTWERSMGGGEGEVIVTKDRDGERGN